MLFRTQIWGTDLPTIFDTSGAPVLRFGAAQAQLARPRRFRGLCRCVGGGGIDRRPSSVCLSLSCGQQISSDRSFLTPRRVCTRAADESRCRDGAHLAEQVAWLAVEAHTVDAGAVEIGRVNSPDDHDRGLGARTAARCSLARAMVCCYALPPGGGTAEWIAVEFERTFAGASAPVVISQIQTHFGPDWVKTRHRAVSTAGFQVVANSAILLSVR
eukprot:SAG31_NODE_1646_length_7649_cov_3.317616_12_plen_215_part_00